MFQACAGLRRLAAGSSAVGKHLGCGLALVLVLCLVPVGVEGSEPTATARRSPSAVRSPKIQRTATPRSPSAKSKLSLAPLFTDRAVLEAHAPVPVWGCSIPNDTVSVFFQARIFTGRADATGRWTVTMKPLARDDHQLFRLTVRSSLTGDTIRISDVAVGDVWLCAGQSNIDYPIGWMLPNTDFRTIVYNANARVRRVVVPVTRSDDSAPGCYAGGGYTWLPDAQPNENISQFSAVCYVAADKIQRASGLYVGAILTGVGGTRIESWFPPETPIDARATPIAAAFPYMSDVFELKVAPLVPYALRGLIWYQGESNGLFNPSEYRPLLETLISSWRHTFASPDLPVILVQICTYGDITPANVTTSRGEANFRFPEIRDAQAAVAQKVSNVALASTIDQGTPANESSYYWSLHSPRKRVVGERVAACARSLVYGDPSANCSGPMVQTLRINPPRVGMLFANAEPGLCFKRRRGKCTNRVSTSDFAVAGADGRFFPAEATIMGAGTYIVLESPDVPEPVAVRYAWSNFPAAQLYSKNGIPAVPFRTDTFNATFTVPRASNQRRR